MVYYAILAFPWARFDSFATFSKVSAPLLFFNCAVLLSLSLSLANKMRRRNEVNCSRWLSNYTRTIAFNRTIIGNGERSYVLTVGGAPFENAYTRVSSRYERLR